MVMIEQLQIKCPSCGIILEVRNSKREAVKRIVCPNCKKTLEVNFEEDEEQAVPAKPLESLYYGEMRIELQEGVNQIALPDCAYLEIKVVRLKDGNSKCLVRPLGKAHPVMINRQELTDGEQVALAIGDRLQTGKTLLGYGRPVSAEQHPQAPFPIVDSDSKPVPPKRSYVWFYTALTCAALTIITIFFWPTTKEKHTTPNETAQCVDTVVIPQATTDNKSVSPVVRESSQKKETVQRVSTPAAKPQPSNHSSDLTKQSDFELEKLALDGNAEAQYVLGNRLVHRSGSSSIIRGLKYLRLAAASGSSKAKSVLGKAVYSLQQRAESGDSMAYYVLKSI